MRLGLAFLGLLAVVCAFCAGVVLAPVGDLDVHVKVLEAQVGRQADHIDQLQRWIEHIEPHTGFCAFPTFDLPRLAAGPGRVLAASPADNVYVISLGSEDGVRGGFRGLVVVDQHTAAQFQVTDVQRGQSAIRLLDHEGPKPERRARVFVLFKE